MEGAIKKYCLVFIALIWSQVMLSQSLMVPAAKGAWGNLVYGGAGISMPQVGSDGPDMTGLGGFGIGNPYKNIGIDVSAWMTDVSEQSAYSFNIRLFRSLGFGSFLAIGMNHVYMQESVLATPSAYMVASHDFAANFGNDHFLGKLTLTGGYGNGRFQAFGLSQNWFKKSGFFGSLHYRILQSLSWELEWDGFEFNSGFVLSGRISSFLWSAMIGAADLGPTYSKQTRMIASFGLGIDVF